MQTPFDDAGIATEEKEDDDDEDNDEGASVLLNLPFFTDDVFFSFFSFFFCAPFCSFFAGPLGLDDGVVDVYFVPYTAVTVFP